VSLTPEAEMAEHIPFFNSDDWCPVDTQIDDDFFPYRHRITQAVVVLYRHKDIEGTEYYEMMFDK